MDRWRRSAVILGVMGLLLAILGRPDDTSAAADPPATVQWPMVGGDATRSAQGNGGPPFLERLWARPLLEDNQATQNWLQTADRNLLRRGLSISANQPILVTVTLNGADHTWAIYRTYAGLEAIDLKTGKLAWEAASKWGMANMLGAAGKMATLNSWLNFYISQNQRPSILYENSRLGTLSTDGHLLYAVDDLAVPPVPQPPPPPPGSRVAAPLPPIIAAADLKDAVAASKLKAYDLEAFGKLKWEVGGVGKNVVLADSFFLGPPLPYKDKLYVLLESPGKWSNSVFFLCPGLDAMADKPQLTDERLASLDPTTGKVLSDRLLIQTGSPIGSDTGRRIAAAHLAAADGVLVAPTNGDYVVGLDLQTNQVIWQYDYWEQVPHLPQPAFVRANWPQPPDDKFAWKVTPPVISEGKVVFAPRDSSRLLCLNLKNGSPEWTVKKAEDDLYLAGVFAGKALVVGGHSVKAYSLAKGELAWQLDTGVPSGFGAASDDIYYLPIRESVQSKEPEVCAINVAKGQILAHTKSRKQEIPGNLLFASGQVVSMTEREIVVYPQLKVRIQEIDDLLAKNPNDPQGLIERGNLRLDQGELQGATDDLLKALDNKPDGVLAARARNVLYAVLTDYLQRDFDKAEKYLKEYEALGKIDKEDMAPDERTAVAMEEKRRRATYLLLVAKGREHQGKLVDALRLYLEFGQAASDAQMIHNPEDPAVLSRPSIWVRQHIEDMLENASPKKAKELQDEIEKRWKDLKGAKDNR